MHYILHTQEIIALISSLIQGQKALSTSHLHTPLDPFASLTDDLPGVLYEKFIDIEVIKTSDILKVIYMASCILDNSCTSVLRTIDLLLRYIAYNDVFSPSQPFKSGVDFG